MKNSEYITVIGLEIHAELLTKSKVFCTCSAEFGGDQNTRCCPVCSGMPGTLPVINQTAVEYAVKAGFALNCGINKFSVFDRKNYFYPDLPKAYQISQLNLPLCINGHVPIEVDGVKKNIRVNRIHLEEDAGKLVHDDFNGVSLADYNRCGIPLIEIVTEPDISSAEEAKAFVEQVSLLLQYAGVCDCKMEQGSLRCDVNISLMKPTDKEFGTRAEIKNLNSIKAVGRAIEYEERRQALLLDAGKRVVQETRRYNDNRDETKSMRSKENAHDYRYFPEPDILQVNFTDEMLDEIRAKLPELPTARLERYTAEYGLSDTDANILVSNKKISDFYDAATKAYHSPKSIAAFVLTEFMRRVNLGEIDIDALNFTPDDFAELVKAADEEKISKNDAKAVFRKMVETGEKPLDIAKANGYIITVDTEKVDSAIDELLSNNPEQTAQYANGETKLFGFFMGNLTKALKGAATPKVIKERLEEKLKNAAAFVKDNSLEQNDSSLEEKGTENLTLYKNANKYVPDATDNEKIGMVGGINVLPEFTLTDATEHIGEEITVSACVHKIKNMGKVAFISLRTGEYVVQAVYSDDCNDSIEGLREGQYVNATGILKENKKDPNGVEIVLSGIRLISKPKEEYPLKVSQKKLDCTIEVNLDNRSVSLRNPRERAIFKLQEGLVHGMHEFMQKNHFTEIHTPKIVAQGAEGGANIFKIDYFQKPAFLNQSPQFYKQTAVAFFDRVYEIAPVYRAEKHATSRHINEYIGLDFEMGYIDSMYDVMNMEIAMLRHIMTYLEEHYSYELKLLDADVPKIGEVPTIKFADAVELLRGKSVKTKFDLDPEDEVNLGKYAKEKYNSDFIFITHFPSSKPPFYAMDSREDPRVAYKFDLLFRGLEITSGGQRIHDYDEQVAKMKRQGLDPKDFESYLEAHKYGLPPHGGLGIGLERLLMKLLNLSNIRSTSMFPRDLNRLLP